MKVKIFYLYIFILSLNLKAQSPQIWGVTTLGGDYGNGVIFSTDVNGSNQSVKFSLQSEIEGRTSVASMLEASNGKLYGMTNKGGIYNFGLIYEYDINTSNYVKLHDFDGLNNGSFPRGNLIEATDGKLYGMTTSGGSNNGGVLFEYDLTNSLFGKLVDFDGITNGLGGYGSLLEASNGDLYGLGGGKLFRYNISNGTHVIEYDNLYSTGSMMEATNGKLYGMTQDAGLYSKGTIFEYNPITGIFTNLFDFSGSDGSSPTGELIEGPNGKLYGMTTYGGDNSVGVLFEYDIVMDLYVKKLDFDGVNFGSNPDGSLVLASNGLIYGMTQFGGINNYGVMIEFNLISGVFTKLVDFDVVTKGRYPHGNLIQATNGKLYGVNETGGTNNYGVLFEFEIVSNTFVKRFNFNNAVNGNHPNGLTFGTNGKFYGTTYEGGSDNGGVIFEFDTIGSIYTKKIDFSGFYSGTGGVRPVGKLIEVDNGVMYGMANTGGNYGGGIIYEYNYNTNTYMEKYQFNNIYGESPYGSLMKASNGKLYGLTNSGGNNGYGVLFEYDSNNDVYQKKFDFDNLINGGSPKGSLIEVSGNLFGVTYSGGTNGAGVLFRFNIVTDNFSVIHNFSSNDGRASRGSLILGANDKLYGLTSLGGTYDYGTLYEYDLNTESFIKLVDFDGVNRGISPFGSFIETYNEKMYGMTSRGGIYNRGILFEYDINTNTFQKKIDFNGDNGMSPSTTDLVFLNNCPNSYSNIVLNVCETYTVPSGDEMYTSSGSYVVMDTIMNYCGSDSIITINLTINDSNTGDTVAVACDAFDWYNTIYTNSATLTHTLTNMAGCDSVVTLDLTINVVDVTITTNDPSITANAVGASYQWMDSNYLVIPGETNQTFTASINGEYAVEVTENGCVDTSSLMAIFTVGVFERSMNEVVIYPNPSRSVVNVDFGFLDVFDIKVYSIDGKLIYKADNIKTEKYQFELNRIKGMYFVEIISDNNKSRHKIVLN